MMNKPIKAQLTLWTSDDEIEKMLRKLAVARNENERSIGAVGANPRPYWQVSGLL
jgi:hypothetical protein